VHPCGGSGHPKITHELLIDLHAYRQAQMIDLAAPGSCTGNEPDPRPSRYGLIPRTASASNRSASAAGIPVVLRREDDAGDQRQ
jgi:hypothetical protein